MLEPNQVIEEAEKKENENLRFRSYLKNHADEDTLDHQFHRLHQKCPGIMIAANARTVVKNTRV